MSSFEPGKGADEMQSGKEVPGGFLVACGDASELLDVIEEALDQIALAVESIIAIAFDFPIGFWRDDGDAGAQFKAVNEAAGVIAFVSQKGFGLYLGGQRFGLGDVVDLATGEAERQGISQGIDNGVDFRREAAARAAHGLVEAPFLRAPALC